jgi:transcriptional regulator with XRE-family HTH domain
MIPAMASREGPDAQAAREARERVDRVVGEIRRARIDTGITQETLARRVGVSRARVGRIELHTERHVPAELLVRMVRVVGLDLGLRTYPGPDPTLDGPQRRLLQRLALLLGPGWRYSTEVPLPIVRDKRAWDSVWIHRRTRSVIYVEAETRLGDVQALLRRLGLKRRDGGATRMVLVVADTRHDRAVVRAAAAELGAAFPAGVRVGLSALREGHDPGADLLLLV